MELSHPGDGAQPRDVALRTPPLLLRPMLTISDRLRDSARQIILATVLVVPGLITSWSYASAMTGQSSFANRESSGLEVVRPALAALSNIAAGRPADLSGLSAAVGRHPELGLGQDLAAVQAAGTGGKPADRAANQGQALAGLITTAGDSSKLILDPDLDSFYAMDLQVVQLPKLLVAAVQATRNASTNADLDRSEQRAVTAGQLTATADAIDSDIATASRVTPALGRSLVGLGAAAAAARTLSSSMTTTAGVIGTIDLIPVTKAASAAVDPAADALGGLLSSRAVRLDTRRDLTLALTLIGLVLAQWFGAASRWRIRHDVGLTLAGVNAIAAGDLDARPLPSGRDEIADIGRSLETARQLLFHQREDLLTAHNEREQQLQVGYERQRAAEAQVRLRAQAIIDETATGVIVELQGLITQVDSVRQAARAIEQRVSASDAVTRGVVGQAKAADTGAVNLGHSLRSVAEMANLIRGVADQTKLLALNAAIEAARAGTAGRGFSVVADEVKTLATATARSTQQITSTIGTLENDAGEVAQAITGVGSGIAALDEATVVLRGVADNQFAVVAQLDAALAATIERVGAMATLSERLERRHAERQILGGTVQISAGGETHEVPLIDLSLTGLRCAPGGPGLEPGRSVRLRVRVDGTEFSVGATVIRADENDPSGDIGMAFVGVDAPTLSTLRRLTAADA